MTDITYSNASNARRAAKARRIAAYELVTAADGRVAIVQPVPVELVDLDGNGYGTVAGPDAARAQAEALAAEAGVIIRGVDAAGAELFSVGTEAAQEDEAEAEVEAPRQAVERRRSGWYAVLGAAETGSHLTEKLAHRALRAMCRKAGVAFVKPEAAAKPAKAAATQPNGAASILAPLMLRDGGATAEEMRVAAGWGTKPSSFYLGKMAKAKGYGLVKHTDSKPARYAFTPA